MVDPLRSVFVKYGLLGSSRKGIKLPDNKNKAFNTLRAKALGAGGIERGPGVRVQGVVRVGDSGEVWVTGVCWGYSGSPDCCRVFGVERSYDMFHFSIEGAG